MWNVWSISEKEFNNICGGNPDYFTPVAEQQIVKLKNWEYEMIFGEVNNDKG